MTIDERIRNRADQRPDRDTLAWWHDQHEQIVTAYRGLTHACNVLIAEMEDLTEKVNELRGDMKAVKEEQRRVSAEIGRINEAVEGAREAFTELNKKVKK